MSQLSAFLRTMAIIVCVLTLTACVSAPQMATPDQMSAVAPEPVEGNEGQYLCPYTSDRVLAEWVDKAINAKMGAAVGSAVGTYMGRKALENVPFIGGFLGQKVGNAAGRSVAIKASGGMEFIKASSDLSFNSLDDLAVYIYANYGATEHYQSALEATWEIYPELKQSYYPAISRASRGIAQ